MLVKRKQQRDARRSNVFLGPTIHLLFHPTFQTSKHPLSTSLMQSGKLSSTSQQLSRVCCIQVMLFQCNAILQIKSNICKICLIVCFGTLINISIYLIRNSIGVFSIQRRLQIAILVHDFTS